MPAGHVKVVRQQSSGVVKLDFANAFNSLHRRDMLLALRDSLPELYPYSYSAYAYPLLLFYMGLTRCCQMKVNSKGIQLGHCCSVTRDVPDFGSGSGKSGIRPFFGNPAKSGSGQNFDRIC